MESSLWFATAAAAPDTVAIEGQVRADVCIIGGGYTGLSSALHLAEKGVSVALLEAKQIGYGGSGRNAGHCTPTFHVYEIPRIRQMLGEPYASRLIAQQTNAANLVFDIIQRHRIDCEAVQNGYVQPAHAPAMLPKLEARCRTYQEIGKAARMLDRDETRRLTGSPRYFGAWFHPEGGHLNPLGYARGLARAALSQGARIYTDSPASAVVADGTRWRVEAPRGSVVADKVICGTGAYTSDYWPGLQNSFTILSVACLATRPLSDNLRKSIAPENHTVVESRGDPAIYKLDKDGRLVTSVFVEGRRGSDLQYTQDLVATRLKWLLPQIESVEWEFYWYGDLDMQPRTIPRLYGLAPGIVASLGYSGRGVPTATMMGTVLAEWAMGSRPEDLALPIEPLQGAPFYMKIAPRILLPYFRFRDQWMVRRAGVTPPRY
jgi:glycine/D-amino acid oxidase-like deaminating enzyme